MWILDIMGVLLAIAGVCFVLAMVHDLWAVATGNEKRWMRSPTHEEIEEYQDELDEMVQEEDEERFYSSAYSYLPENIFYGIDD